MCKRDLEAELSHWLQWLQSEQVSEAEKLCQLHHANHHGYTPLHYAALHYIPDVLTAALRVKGGTMSVDT